MPKIFKFTQFSLRDLIVTAGPMTILVIALCYVAYRLVDPSPPKQVTLATGQENSAYEEFGKKYVASLAKFGIKVTLVPSLGSQENLQRLMDPDSGVDIAFVQSGSIDQQTAKDAGLVSLGSLFTEPVWLFYRESKKLTQLTQLKGMRVNVGPEGTGVPKLFNNILSVNGLEPRDVKIKQLENTPATVELLELSLIHI